MKLGMTGAARKTLREEMAALFGRSFSPVAGGLSLDAERYATLKSLAASMDVAQWEHHHHGWHIDLLGDGEIDTLIDQICPR